MAACVPRPRVPFALRPEAPCRGPRPWRLRQMVCPHQASTTAAAATDSAIDAAEMDIARTVSYPLARTRPPVGLVRVTDTRKLPVALVRMFT